jgi:hypothetical protein
VADSPERRLTVLDCVTLLAALAIGFATVRLHFEWLKGTKGGAPDPTTWAVVRLMLMSTALCCSLALAGLWLRRPRAPWRELGRKPGFVTGVAAIVEVFFQTLTFLDHRIAPHRWSTIPASIGYARNYFLSAGNPLLIAPLIVVSWATLALSGRWSPDRSWLDRAGRGLGVFWIGWAFVEHVLRWVGS